MKNIPESTMSNIAIFAAPANLLLVGYLTTYGAEANMYIAGALATLGIASYIAMLICMPFIFKKRFYPSYAGFTFPLAISMVSVSMIGRFYGVSTWLYDV